MGTIYHVDCTTKGVREKLIKEMQDRELIKGLKLEHNRLCRKYPAKEDHEVIRALEERISYLERDIELSKNKVDNQLSG